MLRRRAFRRIGDVPLNLKKRLDVDGEVYRYALKTRGYYYELANPVPIKSAINAMGFNAGPFRLPLVPLTDDQLKSVLTTIGDAGEFITFAKPGVKVA